MNGIIAVTDTQTASIEQSLGQLHIADQPAEQHEAQADDLEEDMQGAEMAMEDELLALKALRDIVAELKASIEVVKLERAEGMAEGKADERPQPAASSISVRLEGGNYGVQFGVNHTPIGGIHLGQPK